MQYLIVLAGVVIAGMLLFLWVPWVVGFFALLVKLFWLIIGISIPLFLVHIYRPAFFSNLFRSFESDLKIAKVVKLGSGEFVISSDGNYWGVDIMGGVVVRYYKTREEAEAALASLLCEHGMEQKRRHVVA